MRNTVESHVTQVMSQAALPSMRQPALVGVDHRCAPHGERQ
ncbi:MAG: hypothetical protein NTY46_14600 [Candidatus Sumerlaeota bacterium]|nr:hypothetical protein [Candidatus Sumerlaeota bacterium]